MFFKKFIGVAIMLGISSFSHVHAVNTATEIKGIHRLPDEIIRNGQYIVTDLDGTILNTFNGKYEPPLSESPCQKPLLDWLKSGGRVVAITGNDLNRTIDRFFNHIPKDLRANNQLIVVANGGSAFYGTDSEGNLVEDVDYRMQGLHGESTLIPAEHVDELVKGGIDIINAFFADLRKNPNLLDNLPKKFPFLVEIAQGRTSDFTAEELLTTDISVVPRIEKRCIADANLQPNSDLVTQIGIVGIPALSKYPLDRLFSDKSGEKSLGLIIKWDGLTLEINRSGMDKSVSVLWIVKNASKFDFIPEMSFSMGDRPNENDGPLMKLQEKLNMPFISVSEKNEKLPEGVYNVGGNCTGAAKVLNGLVNKAYQLEAENELSPVIPTKLEEVIREL